MTKNTSLLFTARPITGVALVLAACSSEPAGESPGHAEQALGAGEFALLNEIEINPPGGTNDPWQYIELEGTANASLAGLQVVVVDGATGRAEFVVNLGSACGGACTVGSNGMFMIKAADSGTGPVGHNPPADTHVFKDAQLTGTSLTIGNTAVLLVQGAAAINEGTILGSDAGNAALPAGDSLLDGVGWGQGGRFAGVTVTQLANPPDAATRFPGHREHSAAAWYAGNLAGMASTITYNTNGAQRTLNFPAGGALTPGAPNVPAEVEAGADAGDGAVEASAAEAGAAEAGADAAVDAPADVNDAAADTHADVAPDHTDAATSDGAVDAKVDAQSVDAAADAPKEAAADAKVDAPPTDGAGGAGGSGGVGGSGGTGVDAAGGSGGTGGSAAGNGGTAGTGDTGGTAGSTNSGGSAGHGTAGAGGSAAGAGGGETPPPGDDGGCGCRVPGRPANGGGALAALLALGAVMARRKRES